MRVVIIDYGSGNLRSVANAVEHVQDARNQSVMVSADADVIKQADAIILPGVGAYKDCMQGLLALPDVVDVMQERVQVDKVPFLGVCVGMQLLSDTGFEHGEQSGLGWVSGEVVPLAPSDASLKVPHMGWNTLRILHDHPILADIRDGDHVYFVHSYYFRCKDARNVLVEVDYGQAVPAVIAQDNIVATQFHPEKSQRAGLQLLKNFLNMS